MAETIGGALNFLPLIVVGLAAAYLASRSAVNFLSRPALIAVPSMFLLILGAKAVMGSTRSDLGRDLITMGALWALLMLALFVVGLGRRGNESSEA